jgi:hypothetical protein
VTAQLLLLAICVYFAGMVLVTYFTRASRRRFLGALAGGLAVAIAGVGVEVLAHSLRLWHYSSVEKSYGPPLMYPVIVLMWAGYSLIGWRVMRRFARRGLVVFLSAVTVLGTLRDYLIADKMMGFITLSPGIVSILVDCVCWAGLTALALGVMRLVAGPASSDRLARRRWEPA